MKRNFLAKSSNDQLRWVILLLAAAVLLPTVCLLWFMNQAVKNERLAIRQKLIDIYRMRLDEVAREKLGFDTVNSRLPLVMSDGFLVFDSKSVLTFPVAEVKEDLPVQEIFSSAFALEFKKNDPNRALAEYNRIAESTQNEKIAVLAKIDQARCLSRLGRDEEAIAKLYTIISEYNDDDIYIRAQKCRAHLLLLELSQKLNNKNFQNQWIQAYDYIMMGIASDDDLVFLGRESHTDKYIPSSLQVFALQRLVDLADTMPDPAIQQKSRRAIWFIEKINTSLAIAETYAFPSFITDAGIENSSIFRLKTQLRLYGHYQLMDGFVYLTVYDPKTVLNFFYDFMDEIHKFPAQFRIYDDTATMVASSLITDRKPIIKTQFGNLENYLADWTVELYIDDSTFEIVAGRQAAIYTWTGILMIVIVLVSGGVAAQVLSRQMKLNRLKNDFIATVTHELKTPLASTRVLVDTLLEGNYQDQKQVTEYLQLISNENARLSRLIDHFLTFSRMERNKQVFEIVPADPAEIARQAAEALQTRFQNHCRFTADIAANLPAVPADKDAMITVLVNLLDNAYKYSYDNRQIELRVYQQKNAVVFAVRDNGIGMTRRVMKRIFNRFYQADSSLTRRAEGAGLGLSIVKYIVDAHHGRIDVESKPGQGSTFMVKLFVPNGMQNGGQA